MQWESPSAIFAKHALTAQGWQQDVVLRLAHGAITTIESGTAAPAGAVMLDTVLPGMGNVHSHAFQRAMAGLTEFPSGEGKDNFWSWREVMYRFTQRFTPEHIEAIARYFYIELLKSGYTAVGEFHYLHHDAGGKAFANPAELSERVVAAAASTGIHLTHLPVFYETATFGGVPAHEGQSRFIHSLDAFVRLLEKLQRHRSAQVTLGVAPHSLRAVTPENLNRLLQALNALDMADCPIHIHAAEQLKEVDDCIAWSGERPVQWLLNHAAPDKRWCLIHSTHMTPDEVRGLAASGAVAGLCPTTEANLGDGIFSGPEYFDAHGAFGIGTDSNVCASPFMELRQLEYSQRLQHRQRNVLAGDGRSTGTTLYTRAAAGGAQALGLASGVIDVGARADVIGIRANDPILADKNGDQFLDTLIFAHAQPPVTDVFIAARHVVAGGHHPLEQSAAEAFAKALRTLNQ